MLAPSHVIVGVVSAVVVSEQTGMISSSPFIYLWAIIGSLLPDIDHKHSRLGRLINPLLLLVIYFLLLSLYPEADFTPNKFLATTAGHIRHFFSPYQVITFVTVLTAAFICQVWAGHRTITHSLLLCAVIMWHITAKSDPRMLTFSVAYISHVILDLFSPQGIQFFYPYGKRIALFPKVASGSLAEGFVVFFLTVILYLFSSEGSQWREIITVLVSRSFRLS